MSIAEATEQVKSKKRVLDHGEVFTSAREVNAMLDLVREEAERIDSCFLEPACGNGNFLAEVLVRKINAVESQYATNQAEFEHYALTTISGIYGIDILEDNATECRERLFNIFNARYSFLFEDKCREEYKQEARYLLKRNIQCGDALTNPETITAPTFDVIIGNPPYQLSDGGYGRSAIPIYQKFVQQAKRLNPKYLTMIIPARWFAGGRGLDEFRTEMLNDKRIRKMIDFEHSNELFPGVDVAGGICYFLWDRDNEGLCEITNFHNGEEEKAERALNEFPILIRQSRAIPVIRKVLLKNENNGERLSGRVSPSRPFGLRTFYEPKEKGIPCWFIQRTGRQFAAIEDITDENGLLDKWKLLIPRSPIAGQTDFSKPVSFYYNKNTRIAKPGECCTESWIVAGAFATEEETISFRSYLFTKIVRFLLLQTVISQDVTRKNFFFIPDLESYTGVYTDEMLIRRWDISKDEWEFIDSRIKTSTL